MSMIGGDGDGPDNRDNGDGEMKDAVVVDI
jgi:hypothetical protein